MIVSLRGTVLDIQLQYAVLECNGVGYKVLATARTLGQLARGEEAFLLTTMVVREDSQTLYGFIDEESREMFGLLQTVSGLGPKLALAAQSVYSAAELVHAITHNDAKTLQKIPGVGKRMAERMVVDLKDKVSTLQPTALQKPGTELSSSSSSDVAVAAQVVEALTGLGFTEKVAEPVVVAVMAENPDADTSMVLRGALSALSKK
ncbi:Holliday junction DNA helicase subunit RuvA [Corynebacterium mustelae]|uniref:Holliday junction branch migration complex subunit RuvA n=1 Tax=Corynebacterium mustelae TaxID=571915 RepID=A0A0G3GY37_9CORY|nr:Holliday junction branch migration protein RuvA [Corynebacterium mustelae]AKK06076.1 Holliday junction DNA helicase subunit RuvA [Corynebacterium mustelae]